jgi:hypothetical protein
VGRVVDPWPAWARAALVACGAAGALHHEMGRVLLPDRRATVVVVLVATLCAAVLAWWVRVPPRIASRP